MAKENSRDLIIPTIPMPPACSTFQIFGAQQLRGADRADRRLGTTPSHSAWITSSVSYRVRRACGQVSASRADRLCVDTLL